MANQKDYEDEEMTVEQELEDGSIVNCAVITILAVEGKDYIVLLPLDENGENEDGEVWFTATAKIPMIQMRSRSFPLSRMMKNTNALRTPLTNIWTAVNLTN